MYSARRCPQAASSLCGVGVRRSFSDGGKSWRTRRMARRKRNVSDLPYTASPLSCITFFVKEQREVKTLQQWRKGVRHYGSVIS